MGLDLRDKKDLVLQMLPLHPSNEWYRQCLEMNMTSEEMEEVEDDEEFIRETKSVLFMEKQRIMKARDKAMTLAGERGGWQGHDKVLQEIDKNMFSVKDSKGAGDAPLDRPTAIILTGKQNDTDS